MSAIRSTLLSCAVLATFVIYGCAPSPVQPTPTPAPAPVEDAVLDGSSAVSSAESAGAGNPAPTPVVVPVGTDTGESVPLFPTPVPPPPTPPPPPPTPTPYPPVDIGMEDIGDVDLEPTLPPYVPDRGRKRMDIDQVNAAFKRATNGLTWTLVSGSTETELFVSLSATLGKPDFLQNTTEDLTASLIFEKFLSDAANQVCRKLVEREVSQDPEERVLMVYVDPDDTVDSARVAVDENLRLLLRRYHSRFVAEDSLELEPWSWLFESVTHVERDPVMGWRAVCVALMLHPDFYTY